MPPCAQRAVVGKFGPIESYRPYGTDPILREFQAINCLATLIRSLRDKGLQRPKSISNPLRGCNSEKALLIGLTPLFCKQQRSSTSTTRTPNAEREAPGEWLAVHFVPWYTCINVHAWPPASP
jgi:hypothetical protein